MTASISDRAAHQKDGRPDFKRVMGKDSFYHHFMHSHSYHILAQDKFREVLIPRENTVRIKARRLSFLC